MAHKPNCGYVTRSSAIVAHQISLPHQKSPNVAIQLQEQYAHCIPWRSSATPPWMSGFRELLESQELPFFIDYKKTIQ